MAREDLESLVKRADSDIANRTKRPASRPEKRELPKASVAIAIWLAFVLLAAFEFETFTKIVAGPAESRIEQDLDQILSRAATSLERYEIQNGALPPLLPNPAIRGLVKYERESDVSYTLTATISNVTMIKTSARPHPFRQDVNK